MRNRKNSGFTLAETLAVVAIVLILMGVLFVNVAARRRAQTRLEFDAIAKEIFIAAQNHLTAAEGQDYYRIDDSQFGTPETVNAGSSAADPTSGASTSASSAIPVYYLVVGSSAGREPAILNQMLPPYAVDAPGTFFVRYQPHPARILDVFYSFPGKREFLAVSGKELSGDDYTALMSSCRGDENISNRERYQDSCVVGWYGGEEAIPQGEALAVPTIEIHNEEQLYVKVTDPNKQAKARYGAALPYTLKLVVEGENGGKAFFTLWKNNLPGTGARISGDAGNTDTKGTSNKYSILLDDVTSELHFAKLAADTGAFQPGEDLKIYVVAYSSAELTNIAKSEPQTTNSLFADPAPKGTAGSTETEVKYSNVENELAAAANFRHLQNLDKAVSELSVPISKASQISDMDWDAEWTDWKGEPARWTEKKIVASTGNETKAGCYYPVSPDESLAYDGQDHIIKGVKVDAKNGFAKDAGLFGTLPSGSSVKDLELIDFDVKTDYGAAGALVGTAGKLDVDNILARNSKDKDDKSTPTVKASGSAGGLIGSMTGGSVKTSAAALVVSSSGGDAGGLIGTAEGSVSVSDSFSGGHTDRAEYFLHGDSGARTTPLYNVSGVNAGGLIGSLSGTVTNCYSTCSANGTGSAGGLIGSASGTISDSYATGLVNGPDSTARAFVGTGTASGSDNKYLWIINQDQPWQKTIADQYKGNLPGAEPLIGGPVAATDVTRDTRTFIGFFKGSDKAQPYDERLAQSYEGKYPMPTVGKSGFIAAAHYGDWPMSETLVVNN